MTEQHGSNSGTGVPPLTEGKMRGTKVLKNRSSLLPATRPPAPRTNPSAPSGGGAGGAGGAVQQLRGETVPPTMLLCATTGEMIHIRYVESINFNQTEAEEIAGKLADDQILRVRTISGKEYEVSVREMTKLDNDERNVEQMVTAIRGCFQRQGSG